MQSERIKTIFRLCEVFTTALWACHTIDTMNNITHSCPYKIKWNIQANYEN